MMLEAVLTDSDFSDGKLSELTPCRLVLAHAILSDDGRSAAQTLFEIALRVAQDFPELHVGVLNCLDYPELAERLPVYVSEFGTQFAALIFIPDGDPHFTAAVYEEDAESFYFWVLGILLARYRPATTREEIIVRVAYDLMHEPVPDFMGERWDDVELRKNAINAARDALAPLLGDARNHAHQSKQTPRAQPTDTCTIGSVRARAKPAGTGNMLTNAATARS
jgi:hypothetical protein